MVASRMPSPSAFRFIKAASALAALQSAAGKVNDVVAGPMDDLERAPLTTTPQDKQHRETMIEEARVKHHQDQPFSTSAMIGGALGLGLPSVVAALTDPSAFTRHPGKLLQYSLATGVTGMGAGLGSEALGRVLTRQFGPKFVPSRWHRDQDPHRWNTALRTAPLGIALLAGQTLPAVFNEMKKGSVGAASRPAFTLPSSPQGGTPHIAQAFNPGNSPLPNPQAMPTGTPSTFGWKTPALRTGGNWKSPTAAPAAPNVQAADNPAPQAGPAVPAVPSALKMAATNWDPAELQRRLQGDVQARTSASQGQLSPDQIQAAVKSDKDNLLWANKQQGWPTNPADSHAAWGIAQHGDSNPVLQADMLHRMRTGGASLVDVAYLTDRINANTRRPQTYGTQGRPDASGAWKPLPMQNSSAVPSLRAGAGLPSMQEQQSKMDEITKNWKVPLTPAKPLPNIITPRPVQALLQPASPVKPPLRPKTAALDQDLRDRIAAANAKVAVPSLKEIESGTYQKGHYTWKGFPLTIETAAGQTRSGVNKSTGKPWSVTLKHSYGYIKETDSAEPGDQMDIFMGDTPESEIIFAVDQNKQDGKTFDETKFILGCCTSAEAKQLYMDNYSPGWKGFRSITPLTLPQFKSFLTKADLTKPVAGQQFADFHKRANQLARK